jgi:hypothetical protein
MTTVLEEFEGAVVPAFSMAIGVLVAYVSLSLFALVGSGELFVHASQSGNTATTQVSALTLFSVIFLFIPLIAPFLASGVWVSIHGVTVGMQTPAGLLRIETVPLLGVLDGGLEPLMLLFLILVGVTLALANEQSLPLRPVLATVVGVVGYVSAAALFTFGSALLYNAAFSALVRALFGQAGAIGTVTYPNPVRAVVRIGIDATPVIAGGAVLGTGWTVVTASDADTDEPTTEDSETAIEEARGSGSGPRPGDELPDLESERENDQ